MADDLDSRVAALKMSAHDQFAHSFDPVDPGYRAPPFRGSSMSPAQTLRASVIVLLSAFVFMGVMMAIMHGTVRDQLALKTNGRDASAEIVDLRVWHGKGGPFYRVSYRYAPPVGSGALSYGHSGDVSADRFATLQIGGQAPIVFDPAKPALSALNYDNVVRTRQPRNGYLIVALPMVFLLGIALILALRALRALQVGAVIGDLAKGPPLDR